MTAKTQIVAPTWPEHFGECCPPEDAADAAGNMFLVAHSPPEAGDFLSAKERGPNVFSKADSCERSALSMWSRRSRAEALLQTPNHRGKIVFRVELAASFGKMKQTGKKPEHHSVWLYRNVLESISGHLVAE